MIDDGGSGYALGRDVFSAAVQALDGRSEDHAILDAVLEKLGSAEAGAIVAFVYKGTTDKAAIARFSAIALELAENGNQRACKILELGAEELHALAAAVQRRLNLQGCPIALLGGLLSEDNAYRRRVEARLSPLGPVIYPAHDALWGAAQMAWEL